MGVCTILADSYHGVEEVDSVYGEGDPAIDESAYFEVEPALGVALIGCSLGVDCSPDAVVVIGRAFHLTHVTRVEEAIEEDAGLSGLGEVDLVALGDEGGAGLGEGRSGGLHCVAY